MENQEKNYTNLQQVDIQQVDLQRLVKDLLEETEALRKEISIIKEENIKKESDKPMTFAEALKTLRGLKK